ncbi:MAG: RelA/SpoT domain-containing protein [Dehalococcoidia bacterium]|nr:RelA/SpoT domain-containing protein [Dehalococcoidia bacterium]
MAFPKPPSDRTAVDAAGQFVIQRLKHPLKLHYWRARHNALTLVNAWRVAHAFPLNTFQTTLRRKAVGVDQQALVSQRIKRLRAIRDKLTRMPWLQLSEMQDIGGCRAVVRSVSQVRKLVAEYKVSRIRHQLIDEDDYINKPKKTGYRSYHLIYSYSSDDVPTWNRLKIEMQFRSHAQHAWATAVETVGTFTDQALKANRGSDEWKRFFALMGTEIALREGTPPVPGTPSSKDDLLKELRELVQQLNVIYRLRAYGSMLKATFANPQLRRARFFLLSVDPVASGITIRAYRASELERAFEDLNKTERENVKKPRQDAVLVSVDSLTALRNAYPSYFMDTHRFVREVERALRTADHP